MKAGRIAGSVAVVTAVVVVVLALAAVEARVAHTRVVGAAPWAADLKAVDESLARRDVGAAGRALAGAYHTALGSRRWEGMAETGDAAVRVGVVSGERQAAAEKARRSYLVALVRAHHERSLDGVLHAAQGFAGLGDREVAAHCLAIADRLAVTADERARLQEVATAL